MARYKNENLARKIIEENRERGMGNGKRERVNVRMLECWNGGLEGLGGLESLESLEFYPLYH